MPIAIVTGASRGLGYALAGQLVSAGWDLVIDARGGDALHDAAASLRAYSSTTSVEAVVGDITSADHRADLIRVAAERGGLDLLINNAGVLGPSPLPSTGELADIDLREIIEVNVVAPLALTQLALPLLRTSGGVVIDITSDAAVEAYPGWGGYGAAKAATEQLRNVLAAEEAERPAGATVWRVDPGDLRTEMHQLAFPGEDISDRPLPAAVAPGILGLLAARPASGRYRLADFRTPTVEAAGADPVALWLTMEVDEFEPAVAFYRDTLGLPEIDGWSVGGGSSDGEAGAVFAVGPAARIEVERPAKPTPGARAAIEYPGLEALGAAHARIAARDAAATPVIRHHRGHSGFTVHDPRGNEIYLWSEK